MLVPKEFDELCRYIHQDSLLIHKTLKDALAEAVSELRSEQCDVIHGFVDELLAGPYDESDLKGIGRRSPAQFKFARARGVRGVFLLIRELTASQAKRR